MSWLEGLKRQCCFFASFFSCKKKNAKSHLPVYLRMGAGLDCFLPFVVNGSHKWLQMSYVIERSREAPSWHKTSCSWPDTIRKHCPCFSESFSCSCTLICLFVHICLYFEQRFGMQAKVTGTLMYQILSAKFLTMFLKSKISCIVISSSWAKYRDSTELWVDGIAPPPMPMTPIPVLKLCF